jgi:AAA family ATP:ADP antiporter
MRGLGVGMTAASLPAVAILGLLALSVAPGLGVVAGVMVAERTIAFALASPALRVLWTVVDAEAKYKAQSFIDTVVFRGGDAASGWMLRQLGAGALGLAPAAVALTMLPLAVAWLALALILGRMLAERAGKEGTGARANPP